MIKEELRSQLANIITKVLPSTDPAIIEKFPRTQGAELNCYFLCDQIVEIVGVFLHVQAVKIVRNTSVGEVNETVKGIVSSLLPTTRGWIHNKMLNTL